MGSSRRFAPTAAAVARSAPWGVVVAGIAATVLTACSPTDPSSAPASTTSASSSSAAPTQTSAQAAANHRKLLLEPSDVSTPADQFAAQKVTDNPGGQEGASTFLVNQDDTRAIESTILVLPDAAAAVEAKDAALMSAGSVVTAEAPEPIPVGDNGAMLSGTAPDGSKAVTLVLFTHDRAVVRMEFGSSTTDPTPVEQLTDIAQKQSIAVRTGLAG